MSPRRRLLLGLLALVAAVAVVAAVVALVPGGARPGGPVAQDRPGPVLIVPGYGGDRGGLEPLAAALRAQGRDARVLVLDGDGTGDLNRQVEVLDRAVADATGAGAASVDVVGYSAGGVVAGLWAVRDDGAARARRIVSLGSPLAGTEVAASAAALAPDACPQACRQLAPGSALLGELAGAGSLLPWLSVWTGDDRVVTPPASARLAGAVNVELQQLCPGAAVDHGGLPADDAVVGLVLRALSPAPIAQAPADCGTLRAAG
ncbi:esterase/lipase family protein [Pseudonocardia spirodelae]|uniref:Lipase n=1 Tax=Pseudonocardia spirodelae TaxID=3133431 RepID=A0ABU8T725_9PSEU